MKRSGLFLAAVALLALAQQLTAAPILVNFDTDTNGNPIANNTPVNAAYPNLDVTFSNNAIIQVGSGGVTSQPNFASGTPLFNGVFEIIFDGLASFVEARNVTNSAFTLTAFDANNNILGTSSVSAFGATANVTATGIKRATFTTNTQYGIDDLRFEQAIPEPTSLVLFGLMGVSAAYFSYRRSKRAVALMA